MDTLVLVLHILAAAGIIGLVLVQHGKGADMGAAFGSGSAGSVFGSAGSANFMSRATAILAMVFFLTSIGLSYLASHRVTGQGVMADQPVVSQPADSVPNVPNAPISKAADQPAGKAAADKAAADKAAPGSKAGDVPK